MGNRDSNGLLLRSDIHRLFDDGWVTVTPDFHFVVSRRLREEFDNGKTYYALDGSEIRLHAILLPAAPPWCPESRRWNFGTNSGRYTA